MNDPRVKMGLHVEPEVIGPYELRPAERDGTGDDGGSLDQAIIARTCDGRAIAIGEIWAAGHAIPGGAKIRIDAEAIAKNIIDTLNRIGDARPGSVG